MNYKIEALPEFTTKAKRLSKKYASFKEELAGLAQRLSIHPTPGISLGQGCYKIRLPIASKGKGKSGGARVITCVVVVEETVYLLTVYDKSEAETVSDKEIRDLVKRIRKK